MIPSHNDTMLTIGGVMLIIRKNRDKQAIIFYKGQIVAEWPIEEYESKLKELRRLFNVPEPQGVA